MSWSIWKKNLDTLLKDSPSRVPIASVFMACLRTIHQLEWQGACHATSAILHIALAEHGVPSELCIGEVGITNGAHGSVAFDHSWIELRGRVFDAAISLPLDERFRRPPTAMGCNLVTQQPTDLLYGLKTGLEPDPAAATILTMDFAAFMVMEQDLWRVTADLLLRSGRATSRDALRAKHGSSVSRRNYYSNGEPVR